MDSGRTVIPTLSLHFMLFIWILLCFADVTSGIECSGQCPVGHYETKPCTNIADRNCKPCRNCTGATYESKPCTKREDRQCIHAAHPILLTDGQATPTFIDGLKVEKSPNVIAEDLHNTGNLETTFRFTAMTQAYDTSWNRESGIKVNIGVLNTHVIPKFVDADHKSDNGYVLKDRNNQDKVPIFERIWTNHCRNPIPDSYSITLEISRDRTTAAREVQCDNSNPARPNCPSGHVNGDVILERDLNTPCDKQGTCPEELESFLNSLVCTESDSLLREIFKQTPSVEHAIRFPDQQCDNAKQRCEQCIFTHKNCQARDDIFERQECKIECYVLPFCKEANNQTCTSFPVECAMGDAYTFTLQPKFPLIENEFQCHVRREKPALLYEMFFYLELPGGHQTERVYKTVYAGDTAYQSSGVFMADYITVEHGAGIDLADEFILIGRDYSREEGDFMNYSVARLKTEQDYARQAVQSVPVHKMDGHIFVAYTQFARPFDYSSDSWTEGNNCDKDITKFKHEQRHYRQEGVQAVKVDTSSDGTRFEYMLQDAVDHPYIRVTAPGNMSVLPWYFRDSELLLDDSLQISLELKPGFTVWNIHVSGKMSNCPGYLSVTINNRDRSEELIRQDLLITCPLTFNVTFHAPNLEKQLSKTFDLHLEDSVKTYQVFLTHLEIGEEQKALEPEPIKTSSHETMTYAALLVIVCSVVVIAILLNKVYIYTDINHVRQMEADSKVNKYYDAHCLATNNRSRAKSTTGCYGNMSTSRVAILFVYVMLRMLYSLVFTFTMFFCVLTLFVRPDMQHLANLDEFTLYAQNETRTISRTFDTHWREELLREAGLVKDIQGACSFYVTELFDSLEFQMDNITSHYHVSDLYSVNSSLSALMRQRYSEHLLHYNASIQNYSGTYRKHVTKTTLPLLKQYSNYLRRIYDSTWLTYTQQLFNESGDVVDEERGARLETGILDGTEVDFGLFLESEDVEETRLWEIRFWEKYARDQPALPSLPAPSLDPASLLCGSASRSRANSTLRPLFTSMDAARFFAPHLPIEGDRGPVYEFQNTKEEYKFVTDGPIPFLDQDIVESVDISLGSMVDLETLWMIFIALDVLLFVYRVSHTYMNATIICSGKSYVENRSDAASPSTAEENHQYYYTSPNLGDSGTMCKVHYTQANIHEYNVPLGAQRVNCNSTCNHNGGYPSNGARLNKQHFNENKGAGTAYSKGIESDTVSKYTNRGAYSVPKAAMRTFIKIILSNALPKVLIGCLVLLICYITTATLYAVLSTDYITSTDVLAMYSSGLVSQINQTNWYLAEQAQYFNNVSLRIYEGQMKAELTYLEIMLQYFDSEQQRLAHNYILEACAITRQSEANWTCAVTPFVAQLAIPVLPCNFVPILPQLLSYDEPNQLKQRLLNSLEPYLQSCQSAASVTMYTLLISLATMFIIHLIGTVFLHVMKSTNQHSVRHTYVTSPLVTKHDVNTDTLPPPPTEESDCESDDGFGSMPPPPPGSYGGGGYGGSGTGAHWAGAQTLPYGRHHIPADAGMRTYPSPRPPPSSHNPDPAQLAHCDFSYSETKV